MTDPNNHKIITIIQKHYKLIVLIIGCVIIIIANSQYADNQYRKYQELDKKMKAMKYQYIVKKSTLMKKTRRTELKKRLKHTGIQEISTPPIIIR